MLNLYKAYADLLTKDQLEGIHRQLWTDLTDSMKLNNVMVIVVFFFSTLIITICFLVNFCFTVLQHYVQSYVFFVMCHYEIISVVVLRLDGIAVVMLIFYMYMTLRSIMLIVLLLFGGCFWPVTHTVLSYEML